MRRVNPIPTPALLLKTLCLVFLASTAAAAQTSRVVELPYELWKIKPDGTGLARLADFPGRICGSAKWSPDGKLIAFDTRPVDADFTTSEIAVIGADGTRFHLLGPGGMPSWSPDGTQIVFHTYENPQTISVMNADGTGRETLINHWGSPRWMPHGNRIALIGADGGLAFFDLATGVERSIVGRGLQLHPGFGVSRDGNRVCLGLYTGNLYIATLNQETMRPSLPLVTVLQNGNCYHASGSPDDKRIIFGWKPRLYALHQLFVHDVDSADQPKPLPGQDTERSNTNPDWSPDGKTIIFSSQQSSLKQPPSAQ
jgi:Tol biopolymer transport system component